MSRNILPPSKSSPFAPPNSVLIEIPANEFSNLASSPPPTRLTTSSSKPTSNWQEKHHQAHLARQAALESMRHRCKDHMDHVVNVSKFVKESRKQSLQEQHRQINSMQRHAEERRQIIMEKRMEMGGEARARRAKVLREMGEERKRRDALGHSLAREEAAERRGRMLEERAFRAARFSPGRALSMSPVGSSVGSPVGSPLRRLSPMSVSPRSFSPRSTSSASGRRTTEEEDGEHGSFACSPVPFRIDDIEDIEEGRGERERLLNDEEMKAARKIVAYCLLAKARRAMDAAGVLGSNLRAYSFEDTTACMESEAAQSAADYVFRALGMRQRGRRMTRRVASREKAERRILLSCLLISLHPDAVLEENVRTVDIEAPVSVDSMAVYCARRMLLCLQAGSIGAIAAAWMNWRRAFMKWKENDGENLLKAMIEDAVATEALRGAIDGAYSEAKNIEEVKSFLGGEAALDMRRQEQVIWHEQLNLKQEKIREAVIKLSGSSGECRLDNALTASSHVRDEHIVHEIMIDLPGLIERVQSSSTIPQETWQKLNTELSSDPSIRDELASRLVHISKLLNTMIPGCFSHVGNESHVELDADFAVGLVSRAVEALEKCQAEAYDDVLREWYKESVQKIRNSGCEFVAVVVEVFQELTKFIQSVKTDVLTYRIRHSAPIVQQFGAAWERSHFEGHVVSGRFSSSLPRTRKLLAETMQNLSEEEATNLRNEFRAGSGNATAVLLTHAVVRLVMKATACEEEDVPECMHLDTERLWKMQNEGQRCALAASLGNIGRQFLASRGVRNISGNFDSLASLLDEQDTRMADVQSAFVAWIERRGMELSCEEKSLLGGMVEQVTRSGDATFGLMHGRVGKTVKERCLRRIKCQRNGMEEVVRGLDEVDGIVEELKGMVEGLVGHVVCVHGESLLMIAKEL